MPTSTTPPRRSAFTLIEMLTVLGIMAIVIAIIIPAMNMGRRAAKNADVRTTLVQLGNACSSFQNDQRHLPGYFSARQMGSSLNGTTAGSGEGFTSMENIMLDLVGGITQQNPNGTDILAVGPDPAKKVNVDITAMGASTQSKTGVVSRNYLAMEGKRFVAQSAAGARAGVGADHPKFPTLVDGFGSPILAWAQDDIPSTNNTFAAVDTTTAGNNGAKVYWAQNAGFLCATKLGKVSEDQTLSLTNKTGSVIGKSATAINLVRNIEALVGNPSAPDPAAATPKPLNARGPILFHSAGADGIYLGIQDKGARSGVMSYTPNQDPMSGSLFDDLIATGGN